MGQCVPLIYAMPVLLMIGFYGVPWVWQRIPSRYDRNLKEATAQKTPQDVRATVSGTVSADVLSTGTIKDHSPELKGKYSSESESRDLHSAKPSGEEVKVGREDSSCPYSLHHVDKRDSLAGTDTIRDHVSGLQGNKRDARTRGQSGDEIAAMETSTYITTTALFVELVLVIFTSCWICRNWHVMGAAAGIREPDVLHRHFLRNSSKNLKVVYTGDGQTAGTRSIDDFYTDLRITVASPDGMSFESDGDTAEDVEPLQLLKRNSVEMEKTSTTLVRGTTGIGKSTLIQKIIHDWASKNKYKEFKYIFSFKFHILNAIRYVTNLNTLVLEAYPHLETYLGCVWNNPKTILFILDDLDQFEQKIIFADDEGNGGPPGQCINPHSNGFVLDILTSLIQGRLVKGCSILVTTHSCGFNALQETPATPTFHLTGFTLDKVKDYIHRHFGDKTKAEQLVQLLEASDTWGRLSVIPLFCSVLASLPECSHVGKSPMLALTHTRVFSAYLTSVFLADRRDAQKSRQSLLNLGEEAYKKITDKNFAFEAQSLSEVNQYLPKFTSAFMMEIPGKGEGGIVYKFTYPVLQNFVAALAKSRNTPGTSLKGLLNEAYTITDGRLNVFSRFLVGLCSRRSTDWLDRVLGSISFEAPSSISDWIKESVKTRHDNLAGKITQDKFLNILYCLFEFGNLQLATEALEPMRTITLNQCSLNTFDCVVLSRTLICCGTIEELDLNSCGIKEKGIRYLQPVLCKCKVLRLKSNQLTDDCIESLISVVQTNRSLTLLDLSNCDQDNQKRNEFTAEKLEALVHNCGLQREIRWTHHEDTEQKGSKLDKASNILNIITE